MKKLFLFICLILSVTALVYAKSYKPGYIHRAYLEYVNERTVAVTAGYGECNGKYWKIDNGTEIRVRLDKLDSQEGFLYIYIDESLSEFPAVKVYESSFEPYWDKEKNGWYSHDDRCIGAVWSPKGKAIVQEFRYAGNDKYLIEGEPLEVIYSDSPDGEWQTVESKRYIPLMSQSVFLWSISTDEQASGYHRFGLIAPMEYARDVDLYEPLEFGEHEWVPVAESRNLIWQGDDDPRKTVEIAVMGWQLKR